jgi:hypothetical protein
MAAKDDHTINCAVAKDGYVPEMPVPEPEPEKDPETLLVFDTVEPEKPAVQAAKKGKEREQKGKLTWGNPFGKIKDFCGSLYDSVHQEMEEIENEEA